MNATTRLSTGAAGDLLRLLYHDPVLPFTVLDQLDVVGAKLLGEEVPRAAAQLGSVSIVPVAPGWVTAAVFWTGPMVEVALEHGDGQVVAQAVALRSREAPGAALALARARRGDVPMRPSVVALSPELMWVVNVLEREWLDSCSLRVVRELGEGIDLVELDGGGHVWVAVDLVGDIRVVVGAEIGVRPSHGFEVAIQQWRRRSVGMRRIASAWDAREGGSR